MRIQTVIALFERYRLIVRRRSWRRTVVDLPWPPLGGDLFGNAGGGAIGIVVGNVVDWRIFGVVDWRVDRDGTAAVVGSIDVDRGPCRNRSNSCNGLFPSLSSPKGSCDAGDGIPVVFQRRFQMPDLGENWRTLAETRTRFP
jgi:hypothetical protein